MRLSIQLALLTSTLFSPMVKAKISKKALVIYGEDGRQEVFEASPLNQKLAKSTATMIPNADLSRSPLKAGVVQVKQSTLEDWIRSSTAEPEVEEMFRLSKERPSEAVAGISFCPTERFVDQPNAGMCSGFLIAPDLLVTAGHCATEKAYCSEMSWVFDYKVDPVTKMAGLDIKEENIYRCKRVVSNALINFMGLDYAVFQLDRNVVGREPLEIRSEGKIEENTPITVIGSPSGLPLKVTTGGNVRKNTNLFFFSANLDTYQGNSGSAVFNADTGVVEGILVRGEEDFVLSADKSCVKSNKCEDTGCRGEDVSRMDSIPEVAVNKVLTEAAITGNVELLDKILVKKLWVDFYGKDKVSILMKAAAAGQAVSILKLVAAGADINLQDLKGNSPIHHLALNLTAETSDALDKLVLSNANLEVKNLEGQTATLLAAENLNLTGIKMLIAAGADKNAVDKSGETVLFSFARKGDIQAIVDLVGAGVDVTVRNKNGMSVLDMRNEKGETLLISSARSLQVESVIELVKLGADINAVDMHGETALFAIVRSHSLEAIKAMLDAGAKVNIVSKHGATPLNSARGGLFSKVKKLLREASKRELP